MTSWRGSSGPLPVIALSLWKQKEPVERMAMEAVKERFDPRCVT
jgi:hypothetical protein